MTEYYYLIDNDFHRVLAFLRLKNLKEYARIHHLQIRKSPTAEGYYYTIPTFEIPDFPGD